MFGDENQFPAVARLSPAFERDRFVLCADGLVSERHRVWDDEGRQILLADSSPRLVRVALAVPLAVATFLAITLCLVMQVAASFQMMERQWHGSPFLAAMLALFVGGITAITVGLIVFGLPRLVVHANDAKGQPLVEIRPAGRSLFTSRYTVHDGNGTALARLCTNNLYNLWRLRWAGYRPDQRLWFVAMEESDSCIPHVIRHMRKYVPVIPNNCSIAELDQGAIWGKLDRQGKDLRNRLDLIAGQEHLDRRVAVALAMLIDRH